MNRKHFLKSFAFAAVSGSTLLAACSGEGSKTENKATSPEETKAEEIPSESQTVSADCNDLSGVDAADLKQRESLGYVAKSAEADKNCSNCRFYQAGSQPNGCGGCQLFKGPVSTEGYCKSWFKKEA